MLSFTSELGWHLTRVEYKSSTRKPETLRHVPTCIAVVVSIPNSGGGELRKPTRQLRSPTGPRLTYTQARTNSEWSSDKSTIHQSLFAPTRNATNGTSIFDSTIISCMLPPNPECCETLLSDCFSRTRLKRIVTTPLPTHSRTPRSHVVYRWILVEMNENIIRATYPLRCS